MSITPRLLGLTATLSLICLFSGGCMDSTVTRLGQHKLSAPTGTTSTGLVHEPGAYKVKWVASKDRSGTIEGSERWFVGGDRVGFQTTQEGTLVAIAGKEEFPLDQSLPKGTRRVVWYSRREEPSDLTKTTGAVLNGAGTAVVVGGTAVVVGGVLVGVAALEDAANAEHCDDDDYQQQRHHDHRH